MSTPRVTQSTKGMKAYRLAALVKFATERGLSLECDYRGPVDVSFDRADADFPFELSRFLQGVVVDGKLHWEYWIAKQDVLDLRRPRFITDDGETLTMKQAKKYPILQNGVGHDYQ